jgi:dehydrodolichyl diphosphate syntase complex subunit NUS1
MTTLAERHAFHTNKAADGHELSIKEREQLLRPYLPAVRAQKSSKPTKSSMADSSSSSPKPQRRRVVRPFVKDQLQFFLFTVLHFFFSLYIRLRMAYHAIRDRGYAISYYHHRTPEYIQRDTRNLKRLPKHLSVILDLDESERNPLGLERLLNDVGEIAAWCVSAGIPALSVYEKSGRNETRADETDVWQLRG